MISVSVGEAKNKLPYFLHMVEEQGESVQITRHGKTVAVINNQETFNTLDKKQIFTNGLQKWREKYADYLSNFSNTEIDKIFTREKDDEPILRHPEDFN